MRFLLIGALVAACVVLAAHMVGNAIDQAMQEHVLITRNGQTLDCERITDVAGNVFYDSCVTVP